MVHLKNYTMLFTAPEQEQKSLYNSLQKFYGYFFPFLILKVWVRTDSLFK